MQHTILDFGGAALVPELGTDVAAGTYTWAVGLVDTTKENAIGILLSARDEYQTAEGWVKVGDITIQ